MNKTVGITGPNGFIARWVIERLGRGDDCTVVLLDRDAWKDAQALKAFVQQCDTIIHLAGVNRGRDEDVETVNIGLSVSLVNACRSEKVTPHLIFSSTTKRDEDTPYGRGKHRAEVALQEWAAESGGSVTTLVIPNIFGAGCSPFYNSVVATFCHQLTHGESPSVTGDAELELLWVGDAAEEIVSIALGAKDPGYGLISLRGSDPITVSDLLSLLTSFRDSYFERDVIPDLTTPLKSTLYSTFLSHLELEAHVHRPPVYSDTRGELCEVIKTDAGGQVFFSTTAPGITRGNHYHTRKIEWFCVVRGKATIRLRSIHDDRIYEFYVTGDRPQFLSIPVLHTHSIENTSDTELLTLFWTNELFDASNPDTFYDDVLRTPVNKAA